MEKVLEREREPREPERNHRSSTTRAVAGGASGRLREPMSTATPSPVGKHTYIYIDGAENCVGVSCIRAKLQTKFI